VYLREGQNFIISGAIETDGVVATVQPQTYTKGTQILTLADGVDKSKIAKIGLTKEEWALDDTGKLYMPYVLYVSGTGDDTTGDGSEEKPYKTIAGACAKIAEDGKPTENWKIFVSGEITGASQSVPITLTAENAKSLTITGATGLDSAGVPQDVLNMNKADSANGVSDGTVLTISTSVPVTIKNLKITGGYGSLSNAGGITIAKGAIVSLGDGALITGNKNGSNGRGGAIHNEGTLFMYGSAVIGDKTNGGKTDESLYAYAADSSSATDIKNKKMANWAPSGGGIYNGSSSDSTVCAKLYLGYKLSSSGEPVEEELTGGLYYNGGTGGALYNAAGSIVYFDSGTFAWNGTEGGGGAIHNAGTLEMTGGTIEHNRAIGTNHGYGGGVYNDGASSKFIMSAGTINHNLAYRFNSYGDDSYGGGVYNAGSFYMYGTAVIGDKDATTIATADSEHESDTKTSAWGNKAKVGGGIYNTSSGFVYLGYKPDSSGSPVEAELTGGIYHNYATGTTDSNNYGGGAIYNYGGNSGGFFKIASGTIAYNATGVNGGAIWHIQMNYSAPEILGGTIKNNAAEGNGGAVFIASANKASLKLSANASIPAGADGKHDIYLTASKTYYPKITLGGKLRDDFAVRLTPGFYDTSMAVLTLATDVTDTTLEAEHLKFSVADEVNAVLGTTTQWTFDNNGKLASANPLGTLDITIEESSYSPIEVKVKIDGSNYNTTDSANFPNVTKGQPIVFMVTSTGYSSYKWYVDGEENDKTGMPLSTTSTLTLDTTNWAVGMYDIALEAKDSNDNWCSYEAHITLKSN